MIIWKNICGESWQRTIENGWEVSGKPGAFLFFIPKGALTHHLLKQAVVALPLVGHVRSPRGIAAPAGAAGQGCISAKLPALPMQSAQGFPFWKPLFMRWYIATPSRRLPASTCHRQLDTDTGGGTNRSTPAGGASHFMTYQLESSTEEGLLRFTVALRKGW